MADKIYAIASDIHGSAKWCEKFLAAAEKSGADKLLLLGDLLYHGPRNDLPEEYDTKKVVKLLSDEGIEAIDPTGKAFSADEAEAIMAVPAENGEESGTVKQVYLKGYKKGDKVLRYAQVIVIS